MDDVARDFHRDGVAVVRGFCSASECAELREAMSHLIDQWDPSECISVHPLHPERCARLPRGCVA